MDEDKSERRRVGQEGSNGQSLPPFPFPWCVITSKSWMRGGQALKDTSKPARTQIEQHMSNTRKALQDQRRKKALAEKWKKKINKERLETWQFVGWLSQQTRWYQVWFLLADGYREKVGIWSGSDWACTEERNSWSLTHPWFMLCTVCSSLCRGGAGSASSRGCVIH